MQGRGIGVGGGFPYQGSYHGGCECDGCGGGGASNSVHHGLRDESEDSPSKLDEDHCGLDGGVSVNGDNPTVMAAARRALVAVAQQWSTW